MSAPLLALEQVVLDFHRRDLALVQRTRIRAVDHVDLEIHERETVALVGESGSGKTSVARLLAGLEAPTHGHVSYEGVPLGTLKGAAKRRYRRDVQMIYQDPSESLDPRYTVRASVVEPLDAQRIGSAPERHSRTDRMLEQVELRPAEWFTTRLPHELSGGQRQRVAIARALISRPRLVVADEPVSMLDVSVRAGILDLLMKLQSAMDGISILFITHDLAAARYVAGRILVMYRGAIVEAGPAAAVIDTAAHPYTKLLIDAVPQLGVRRKRTLAPPTLIEANADAAATGCRFRSRCRYAIDVCAKVEPPRVPVGQAHWAACHRATEVVGGSAFAGDGTRGEGSEKEAATWSG